MIFQEAGDFHKMAHLTIDGALRLVGIIIFSSLHESGILLC